MKRALSFLRPTLVRRVILALLLAFVLIWIIQLLLIFLETTRQAPIDAALRNRGGSLLATIAQTGDAGEARLAVQAASKLLNGMQRRNKMPGAFLIQLSDRNGAQLFVSPDAGDAVLAGDPARMTDATVDGATFRVFRGDAAGWSLIIAERAVNTTWLVHAINSQMTPYLLVSFLLLLAILWTAVARGLRPLRVLSSRIAAMGPDELAPLNIGVKYAELEPVTAAIDRLLHQLRDKVAREHAFVQDAAHELRTPLALISAQAHVLGNTADGAERARAAVQMDQAIARSSHLIGQLLTMAQIDSGGVQESATVDVAQLVRAELASMAPGALARGIDLSLDAPDGLEHRVALGTFQSIVQNLLANAVRYVHAQGQVRVALAKPSGVLVLTVTDNGPGIPQAEQALVFARFHRGGGHNVAGAGLGLAIVKQAVERLGGTVSLADAEGGGCAFTVELP